MRHRVRIERRPVVRNVVDVPVRDARPVGRLETSERCAGPSKRGGLRVRNQKSSISAFESLRVVFSSSSRRPSQFLPALKI
jgi:hypothetical protein